MKLICAWRINKYSFKIRIILTLKTKCSKGSRLRETDTSNRMEMERYGKWNRYERVVCQVTVLKTKDKYKIKTS